MRASASASALASGCAFVSLAVLVSIVACSSDPDPNSSSSSSSGGTSGNGTSGAATSGGTSGAATSGGTSGATSGGPVDGFTFETVKVQFEGGERTMIVQKPKTYDAAKAPAYPLVLAFHGNPSSAQNMVNRQPFNAAGQSAVVVYPQAASQSGEFFDWDIYGVTNQNVDMRWVRTLPDEIKKTVNIDTTKVFAFGFSGGGFFVSHFACRFQMFAAISSHAGGGPDEEAMGFAKKANGCFTCPGGPVPTLVTHGSADTSVEPASGEFTALCYADTNGCSTTRKPTTAPCELYDGCPKDKPVEWCLVPNQVHDPIWVDADKKTWDFFKPFL